MGSVEAGESEAPEQFPAAWSIAERLLDNLETVVYGKREEIKLVLTALLCGGHVLLEDVPGTAKTVLARSIAGASTVPPRRGSSAPPTFSRRT